jgi:hypothetical protein
MDKSNNPQIDHFLSMLNGQFHSAADEFETHFINQDKQYIN